jgi:hypothetical protein
MKNFEKLQDKKTEIVAFMTSNLNEKNAAAFTKTTDVDAQVYQVELVENFLEWGIPLAKADEMRSFNERYGHPRSTHHSHLAKLIPSILAKEVTTAVSHVKEGQLACCFIFDGTSRVCEAFCMVMRFVYDFKIYQKLVTIEHLAKSMTADDTIRVVVQCILLKFGILAHCVSGLSHDRASVNRAAAGTFAAVFCVAEDWPCLSHTTDKVGKRFVHAHVDDFWHLWITIFAYGKKIAQEAYRLHNGHKHKSFSTIRWW